MKRLCAFLAAAALLQGAAFAGSAAENKLNSINCAKLLAERNIVETVYGIKIKFDEQVDDILNGTFSGSTESKTGKRSIKGIQFEEVKYDPKKDVAQVTATLRLGEIADIVDKDRFNVEKFKDKVVKRVAFASSNPENARMIAAIRAAEMDAYKNLYKRIGGFTLESHSSVKDFALKSDKVKASVIGAIMGAQFVGFSWEGKGDDAIATVKIRLDVKELSEMLGERILNCKEDVVEAEGHGVASPRKDGAKASKSSGALAMTGAQPADANLNALP